jgi:hypothetical protein
MSERETRRLSDAVADAASEDLEYILPDVPGMGEGACEATIRAARRGLLLEYARSLEIGIAKPKKRGRPHKDPRWGKDAVRADALRELAQEIYKLLGRPDGHGVEIRTVDLIAAYSKLEEAAGVPRRNRVFKSGPMTELPSVSRGRKILGIVDGWNSPTCEKIAVDFPANDSD